MYFKKFSSKKQLRNYHNVKKINNLPLKACILRIS